MPHRTLRLLCALWGLLLTGSAFVGWGSLRLARDVDLLDAQLAGARGELARMQEACRRERTPPPAAPDDGRPTARTWTARDQISAPEPGAPTPAARRPGRPAHAR